MFPTLSLQKISPHTYKNECFSLNWKHCDDSALQNKTPQPLRSLSLPLLTTRTVKEKWKSSRAVVSDSLQLVDCNLSGSSLHGILQARILEWVAISFSRGSSWSRDWTWVSSIADRHFNIWVTKEALPEQ